MIPQSTFKAVIGRDRARTSLVFRVHEEPEDMTAALKHFNEVLGPRLGFDPEDPRVSGLWDTVKGQKIRARSCSASSSSSASSAR